MRSWLVACVAAALPGCAQLAGLDKTSGGDPSDRLTLLRNSVGTTVVQTPLDLITLTATYLVRDATGAGGFERVPGEIAEPGTWVADVRGGEPTLLFTLPDGPAPRLFDLGRDVTASYTVLEHAGTSAPPAGATVQTDVTLPAPIAGGETILFAVVGAWVQRPYAVAELPAVGATRLTATFTYDTVTSTASPTPALAAITADDIVMILEYVGGVLTAASAGVGLAQPPSLSITGPVPAVIADQTIAQPIDPAAINARLSGGRPAVGVATVTWSMNASPGGAGGTLAGPTLASGSVAAVDTMISRGYGNPFATPLGWPSTFSVAARSTRVYTPPSQGLPVTLAATLFEVSAGGATAADLAAPLPIVISIADTTILTDGVDLHVDPSRPVTVALTLDHPTATLYQIQLLELVPNPGATALVFATKLTATSRTPMFSVPPEFFETGHIYTLRAISLASGFPNLGTGDVATHTLPASAGTFDSGVFTVVP